MTGELDMEDMFHKRDNEFALYMTSENIPNYKEIVKSLYSYYQDIKGYQKPSKMKQLIKRIISRDK